MLLLLDAFYTIKLFSFSVFPKDDFAHSVFSP
jgi:hypothetical protein